MKAGEKLSATARAERSREATKQAMARELLYAGILARIWPSRVFDAPGLNDEFPYVLAVESPAGYLTWRLSPDEFAMFDWVERVARPLKAEDRTSVLLALATDHSWTR